MAEVLITGASGLLGSALMGKFGFSRSVVGTFGSRPRPGLVPLDVTDPAAVERLVEEARPAIIVHAAAQANVDGCEINRNEAYRANVIGTENVARAAARIGALMVFFSSDYVFDGEAGPYSEGDPPGPVNYYGWTKLQGERAVIESEADSILVRTSSVFGPDPEGRNFLVRLVNALGRGEPFKVPGDQYSTPTLADNLAEAVVELVRSRHTGIYHVAGTDWLSRHTLALMAARLFGMDQELIVPVSSDELGQPATRPLRAGLKVDKVILGAGVKLMGAEDSLLAFRASLGKG